MEVLIVVTGEIKNFFPVREITSGGAFEMSAMADRGVIEVIIVILRENSTFRTKKSTMFF